MNPIRCSGRVNNSFSTASSYLVPVKKYEHCSYGTCRAFHMMSVYLFYFYQILTTFIKRTIMSEVSHAIWRKCETIYRFHNLVFDKTYSNLLPMQSVPITINIVSSKYVRRTFEDTKGIIRTRKGQTIQWPNREKQKNKLIHRKLTIEQHEHWWTQVLRRRSGSRSTKISCMLT